LSPRRCSRPWRGLRINGSLFITLATVIAAWIFPPSAGFFGFQIAGEWGGSWPAATQVSARRGGYDQPAGRRRCGRRCGTMEAAGRSAALAVDLTRDMICRDHRRIRRALSPLGCVLGGLLCS